MKSISLLSLLVLVILFSSCGHSKKPLNADQEEAADSTIKKRDTIGVDHTKADSISNRKVHKF
jgi:hypothetical protein